MIGVKKPPFGGYFADGAQEKTRTSTPLRALGPEPSASTNSATWATPYFGTETAWCPREDSNFHTLAGART